MRGSAPREPRPALRQRRADARARLRRLQAHQLPREAQGHRVGRAAPREAPLLEREEVLRDGGQEPGPADQDGPVPRHAAGRPARRLRRDARRPARRGAAGVVREHPRAGRDASWASRWRRSSRSSARRPSLRRRSRRCTARVLQGRPRLRREGAVPRHRQDRRHRPGEHVVLHRRAEQARPHDGLPLRRRGDAQAHPARAGLHQRGPQRRAHRRGLRGRRRHRRPEDLLGLHEPPRADDGVHRRHQDHGLRGHAARWASTQPTSRRSWCSRSPR